MNENIENTATIDTKGSAESFLNSIDTYNDVITEPIDKPEGIKDEDVKQSASLLITGEAVLKIIDIVFPNTLLMLLSFIDSDFKKIDVKKLELDDTEKEFYRPVGEYIANTVIEKFNPVLIYSIIYFYRTGLIIASEYKTIKKRKTMPLKKEQPENESGKEKFKKNFKFERKKNNSYDDDFYHDEVYDFDENLNTHYDKEYESLKKEIENVKQKDSNMINDLKAEIESLKNLLNEKKTTSNDSSYNTIDKTTVTADTDKTIVTTDTDKHETNKKKRNLSPERIEKLKEQAKKLHEYRKNKKNNSIKNENDSNLIDGNTNNKDTTEQ